MSSDAFAYNSQARFCSPDSYEPGCGAFDKREVPLLLLNIRATRPTHSCINLMRHYEERFGRDIRLSDSYLIRSVVAHMEMSFESATRLSTRVVGIASSKVWPAVDDMRYSLGDAIALWKLHPCGGNRVSPRYGGLPVRHQPAAHPIRTSPVSSLGDPIVGTAIRGPAIDAWPAYQHDPANPTTCM